MNIRSFAKCWICYPLAHKIPHYIAPGLSCRPCICQCLHNISYRLLKTMVISKFSFSLISINSCRFSATRANKRITRQTHLQSSFSNPMLVLCHYMCASIIQCSFKYCNAFLFFRCFANIRYIYCDRFTEFTLSPSLLLSVSVCPFFSVSVSVCLYVSLFVSLCIHMAKAALFSLDICVWYSQ